jgi:hypothetical protein
VGLEVAKEEYGPGPVQPATDKPRDGWVLPGPFEIVD